MKIKTTYEYLYDNCSWEKACDVLDLNPWCINEWLLNIGDEVTITMKQAEEMWLTLILK